MLAAVRKLVGRSWRRLRYLRGASIGSRSIFEKGLVIRGAEYISFGSDCYIGPCCRIEAWDSYRNRTFEPRITFGNAVKINSHCHIGAIDDISIGDDVLVGSNVFITDHSHGQVTREEAQVPPNDRDLYSKGPVRIGKRVWIGENAVILPGVTIGEGSVIGASAVVTKDVPPFSVAAGNPAKVVRQI